VLDRDIAHAVAHDARRCLERGELPNLEALHGDVVNW
jgi:hypothetical protein